MSKIFKYSSTTTAVEIIRKGRVLLNSPVSFNDPFDSLLDVPEKEVQRCIDLITNYFFFRILSEFVQRKDINLRKPEKAIFVALNTEIKAYKALIRKVKMYEPVPFFNSAIKKFRVLNEKMNEAIAGTEDKFKNSILPNVYSMRNKAKISCFSERNDSILMWSHYASSHRGVCIEFEEDRDFFRNVKYSDKKEHLDIYGAVSRILAFDFIGEELNYKDKPFADKMLNPFFSKAKDWSYEQEVRCVLSDKEDNTPGYVWDDNNFYLEMKISKVYIGAKATNDSINEILKLCRNRDIPVVFMKEDADKYSIVPDNEKKVEIDYSEPKPLNCVEALFTEMNRALNFECYISAMYAALTIPGIMGSIVYPELPYKDAYIKWYQGVMGYAEKSPDHTDEAYPSGDLCYALKEAIHNKGNTDINGEYEEFVLTDFVLRIEKEHNIGMYVSLSSSGSRDNGEKFNTYELNIRDFCWKLEACAKKPMKEHKKELDNLPRMKLNDFTKEFNDMVECGIYSDTINKKIREACKTKKES